jgi:hypothetical protein
MKTLIFYCKNCRDSDCPEISFFLGGGGFSQSLRSKFQSNTTNKAIDAQPQTEMSTRNFPVVKGGVRLTLTNSPPSLIQSRKCGSHDISQPHGPSRPVTKILLPLPLPFDVTKSQLLTMRTKTTKLCGLSPLTNYTDRATATCRRSC